MVQNTQLNASVAVIGHPSTVLLYKLVGAISYPVMHYSDAEMVLLDILKRSGTDAMNSPYAVVFIEEDIFSMIPEDLQERFRKRAIPALTIIPSAHNEGRKSFAEVRLKRLMERAVGSEMNI